MSADVSGRQGVWGSNPDSSTGERSDGTSGIAWGFVALGDIYSLWWAPAERLFGAYQASSISARRFTASRCMFGRTAEYTSKVMLIDEWPRFLETPHACFSSASR